MTNANRCCQRVSTTVAVLPLAETKTKHNLGVIAVLLAACASLAQQPPQPASPPEPTRSQASGVSPATTVTIPAGTRFTLVLTSPISSKTVRRGDTIYAETTGPVLVADEVVVPPGSFVQAKVDKLRRNGTRSEMLMQSAGVVFPDGYVANIAGSVNIESDEGTA